MTEEGKKYLSDILRAIDLIEDFTKGIDNFNSYEEISKPKAQRKDS